MITLELIYILMGVLTGGVALVNLADRANPKRINNAVLLGAVRGHLSVRLPLAGRGERDPRDLHGPRGEHRWAERRARISRRRQTGKTRARAAGRTSSSFRR